jgi:hypothetical protein
MDSAGACRSASALRHVHADSKALERIAQLDAAKAHRRAIIRLNYSSEATMPTR